MRVNLTETEYYIIIFSSIGGTLKTKLGIFDLDGTLVDSRQVAYLAISHIFETYGINPPSMEEYLSGTRNNYQEYYHQMGVPKNASRKELNEIFNQIYIGKIHNIPLRPGVKTVLEFCRLKKIKTAIISSTTERIVFGFCSNGTFDHKFDYIASDANKSYEIKKVMELFSVEPGRTFYVGDTPGDIMSAKECYVTTIGVLGGFSDPSKLIKSRPDRIISSMGELLYLIR